MFMLFVIDIKFFLHAHIDLCLSDGLLYSIIILCFVWLYPISFHLRLVYIHKFYVNWQRHRFIVFFGTACFLFTGGLHVNNMLMFSSCDFSTKKSKFLVSLVSNLIYALTHFGSGECSRCYAKYVEHIVHYTKNDIWNEIVDKGLGIIFSILIIGRIEIHDGTFTHFGYISGFFSFRFFFSAQTG